MKRHWLILHHEASAEAYVALCRWIEERAPRVRDQVESLSLDVRVPDTFALNATTKDGLSFAGALATSRREDAVSIGEELLALGFAATSYEVETDVPRDYVLDWPLGTRSPGVRQLTLLSRKAGMGEDAFLHHWHQVHGPLALEVHPIWRYDRNRVRARTEGAAELDGIVALHFRSLEDATDPKRLYGDDPRNMSRIQEDVASFIDMRRIVVAITHEYVIR